METTRIQTGATERIVAVALSSALAPLTGVTDLLISIQRVSDAFWFDFSDLTFKSVGWTTRHQAMTEISSTLAPGQYRYDFVTSTITNATANDAYLVTVTQSPGTTVKNIPQVGEIKVGQWVDNLNATVSSRSTLTQAQILSDTTPFQGARIDAAISSRAAPGAAMDLVTDAVDAAALAADAVAEINTGLAAIHGTGSWEGSSAAAVADAVWDEIKSGHVAAGSFGEEVQTHATQAEILSDATPFQGARIDAAVSSRAAPGAAMDLVTDAMDAASLAADAVAEIQSGLATAAAVAAVQADTDDLQTRLPAALVGGRMDASVGAMANDVLTAAAIAAGAIGSSEAPLLANLDVAVSSRAAPGAAMDLITDAVDANALAADAVAEINAGLAAIHGAGSWEGGTPAAIADAVWDEAKAGHVAVGSFGEEVQTHATHTDVAAVQADTDDIQTRIPATLTGGRMRSHVEAMDADVVGAAQIAAGAIGATEAPLLANLDAAVSSRATQAQILSDATPFPGARIDAAITSRAAPGAAMDLITNAVDAAALAADAITEIDTALSTAHGAGSWEGGTPAAIADAVWDEVKAGHVGVGSFGEEVQSHATPAEVKVQADQALVDYDPATGAEVSSVQTDVDNIQTRLPVALVGGRMDAHVGDVATDVIDANALAASAVTEIQTGLPTAAAVAAVQADTDDIQSRLPASLNGGRL